MVLGYTLPFNEGDVTYYHPLFQRTVVALDQFPTHVTADAAFNYWYVYERLCAKASGAILSQASVHNDALPCRTPHQAPLSATISLICLLRP